MALSSNTIKELRDKSGAGMLDCKKALEQLNNGIDFVIDDVLLEAAFYDERARSYDCLGNTKEALENKNKAVSLRKKRKE